MYYLYIDASIAIEERTIEKCGACDICNYCSYHLVLITRTFAKVTTHSCCAQSVHTSEAENRIVTPIA